MMSMLPCLADAVLTQLALVVCYVGLPAVTLQLWRCARVDAWLNAIVGALCLQSVLGWLWNHLALGPPIGQAATYVMIWLALGFGLRRVRKDPFRATDGNWDGILVLLLLVSLAVRLWHPLQVFYLGQSDAYSHLQYLSDVLETGRVRNVVYPPGYHWVMALPTLLSGLDLYVVARFGGAFAGVLLVLAVYVLAHEMGGRTAARWAAWAVGLCPAAWWLIKTGIGVFPNQFGLLLLPTFFLAYLRVLRGDFRGPVCLLVLTLAAFATAAPMMLVDALLLAMAHQVVRFARDGGRRAHRLAGFGLILLLLLPLAVLQVSHAGRGPMVRVVGAVVGQSPRDATGAPSDRPADAVRTLAADFFRVKRQGLGAPWTSVPFALAVAFFAGLMVRGARARRPDWWLLGAWGVLAALQSGWGILQFTRYQRAGWQLTLAAACGGGLAWSWMAAQAPRYARTGVVVLALALSALTLADPPRHRMTLSSDEDGLVRFVRAVARERDAALGRASRIACSVPAPPGALALQSEKPLTVLTRSRTGFYRGQGDPVVAFLERRRNVALLLLGQGAEPRLSTKRQYLLIEDGPALRTTRDLGLFGRISGKVAADAMTSPHAFARAEAEGQAWLQAARAAGWSIATVRLSDRLLVHVMRYGD